MITHLFEGTNTTTNVTTLMEDINDNESEGPTITPKVSRMAMFAGETVCFALLFVCNYLGICGVKNKVRIIFNIRTLINALFCKSV